MCHAYRGEKKGTDWLRQRSLKELFLDAGDGPVEEGLVDASSGSSASKLRLQDLRNRKRRVRGESSK